MLCRVETGKSKNILVTSTEAGNGTTTIGKALQEGLSLAGKNVKLNDLRILGDEVSSDLFAKISKNEKGADDISGNDAVNIFLVNAGLSGGILNQNIRTGIFQQPTVYCHFACRTFRLSERGTTGQFDFMFT